MTSRTPRDIDLALLDAKTVLQTSMGNSSKKWEGRLNRVGMFVFRVNGFCPSLFSAGDLASKLSEKTAPLQAEDANEAISFLKERLSEFESYSQTLMSALDELEKIHPFIASLSLRPNCSYLNHTTSCSCCHSF
jgi:hypothetical protein